MRGGIWMALAMFALSACTNPDVKDDEAALACLSYANTQQVLKFGKSHIIMLGELHGTGESPEALRQLVCSALQAGEPVRVGLEANWSQSEALNKAVTLPIDLAAILDSAPAMWGVHDGRSSVGVLMLLEQIAIWKAAGHEVSVFAFDGEPSEWASDSAEAIARDETMARQVDLNLRNFDGVTILLTGSFHARKKAFVFGDETFVPMATLVTERPVLSLRMRHGPGEFWLHGNIQEDDGTVVDHIGPYKTGGNASEHSVARRFDLQPSDDGNFDGYYNTGPITISEPAFPNYAGE